VADGDGVGTDDAVGVVVGIHRETLVDPGVELLAILAVL